MAPSSSSQRAHDQGHIIEYIPDRLYLAAFARPPSPESVLPSPESPAASRRRVLKRSQTDGPVPSSLLRGRQPPCYFTIDDSLLYNAFHHDFGPLHIGHLYRFAIRFHDLLGAKENKDRPVIFWSAADPRSRANAACMLACYMVLIQSWPPHLALAPIAQVDPPLMPFRDAGYSQADYGISVQDVVYGVWKAKEESCCDLDNFDLEMYEKFERVENGDFNWITPHFVAFASPQHEPVGRIEEDSDLFTTLPRDLAAIEANALLPQPFKNVLAHFAERNVGLVVRLNSPLYSPSYFEALGIQHLDMIFEDGTCPPLPVVRKFIRLAHETITMRKKAIAVHCKAGLGRTGCLIGAYLIYRHGFTADEVISFMRFMRPGMVVGPQQHWLHLNQGTFRDWWTEERVERRLRREMMAASASSTASCSNPAPTTPIRAVQKSSSLRRAQASTPPRRSSSNRSPLSEVDQDRNNVGPQEDYLPAPTPGQPRKTARTAERHHPYQRSASLKATVEQVTDGLREETELELMQRQQTGASDSDEELHLRLRSLRKQGPSSSRTASQTTSPMASSTMSTTTTTTMTTSAAAGATSMSSAKSTSYAIDNDASRDAENVGLWRAKKPPSPERLPASGTPGVLAKVRSGKRSGPDSALKVREAAGVRKTSGRVGSASTSASSTAASTARKVSGS